MISGGKRSVRRTAKAFPRLGTVSSGVRAVCIPVYTSRTCALPKKPSGRTNMMASIRMTAMTSR